MESFLPPLYTRFYKTKNSSRRPSISVAYNGKYINNNKIKKQQHIEERRKERDGQYKEKGNSAGRFLIFVCHLEKC